MGGGVALGVRNRLETERRGRAHRRRSGAPGELIVAREEAQREGVVVCCSKGAGVGFYSLPTGWSSCVGTVTWRGELSGGRGETTAAALSV